MPSCFGSTVPGSADSPGAGPSRSIPRGGRGRVSLRSPPFALGVGAPSPVYPKSRTVLSVFSYPVPSGPPSPVKPAGPGRSPLSLRALLGAELEVLYHAKRQQLKTLPDMTKAATNRVLKAGLADHARLTRGQVKRLAQAFAVLGIRAKGRPGRAMKGLIEEAAAASALEAPAAVRDAALIGAAQHVAHYEIAGYGTARAFAAALGEERVAELLRQTLDEEGDANKELTLISAVVNAGALALDGDASAAPRRG